VLLTFPGIAAAQRMRLPRIADFCSP